MRSITPLLLAAMIFAGCQGAGAPLGEPSAALFDEAVLGSWVSQQVVAGTADEEDPLYLNLYRFNDAEYYAESRAEGDDEWMRLRIYPTEFEGVMIANVQCVGCEDREWFFFAYEHDAQDRLHAEAFSDEFYENADERLATVEDVRAEVRAYLEDGRPGSDSITFVRNQAK